MPSRTITAFTVGVSCALCAGCDAWTAAVRWLEPHTHPACCSTLPEPCPVPGRRATSGSEIASVVLGRCLGQDVRVGHELVVTCDELLETCPELAARISAARCACCTRCTDAIPEDRPYAVPAARRANAEIDIAIRFPVDGGRCTVWMQGARAGRHALYGIVRPGQLEGPAP